jgi:hypothetical protein
VSVYPLAEHPSELRHCTACRQKRPVSEFRTNPETLSGLHWWCRACVSQRNREWREANADYVNAYNEARRVPPSRLTCTECGEEFYGRKDRLTCGRRCKDARYRRLHPDQYRAKQSRYYARRRTRA